MSSHDRPDGRPGKGAPGAAPDEQNGVQPPERSSRGRIIVRSSSHPPRSHGSVGDARDLSGAHELPAGDVEQRVDLHDAREDRSKRSTPAERPRRRRQVQAGRAMDRERRDTLPANPAGLRRKRGSDPASPEADRDAAAYAGAVESSPVSEQVTDVARDVPVPSLAVPELRSEPGLSTAELRPEERPTERGARATSAPSPRKTSAAILTLILLALLGWILLRG
jgi:hypothetical protein